MASDETGNSTGHDSTDVLIDDLIRDILNEAGQSTKSRTRGGDPVAALLETALGSVSRTTQKSSTIERLLLAQVLASALADALAPALAEALTPEIMKVFEHTPSSAPAGGRTGGRTTPASGPAKGSTRRKT
ncbi:hypothetical protein [Streptosporangium saharense]|uniref:hypothetical protein n=1 Tax=Streptosporangium saharense TaxID=1706840 RepID=UPI0033298065